jgi:hypothetical protein
MALEISTGTLASNGEPQIGAPIGRQLAPRQAG